MADLSNSSFIPKRGPTKKKRTSATRRVYLFTLFSYILMFAVLLASGGVFAYTKILESNKNETVANLAQAISGFSEADMNRVKEFDMRLQQAWDRLDRSVSIVSALQALEASTVSTAQVESLSIEREGDEQIVMSANVLTDSFDSTIFQRTVYDDQDSTISSVEIVEVVEETEAGSEDEEVEVVNTDPDSTVKSVTFKAILGIPVDSVPFQASPASVISNIQEPITISEPVTDDEAVDAEEVAASGDDSGFVPFEVDDNQNDI